MLQLISPEKRERGTELLSRLSTQEVLVHFLPAAHPGVDFLHDASGLDDELIRLDVAQEHILASEHRRRERAVGERDAKSNRLAVGRRDFDARKGALQPRDVPVEMLLYRCVEGYVFCLA